jgi:electron transport complex protein RnfB
VVIAAIVQFTELVIQKTSPLLHQVLGIYLPLITTNCAVLGVPLLNVNASQPARIAAVRLRQAARLLAGADPVRRHARAAGRRRRARPFRGTAIAMITAGLMSLAFMGFAGLDQDMSAMITILTASSSWPAGARASARRWAMPRQASRSQGDPLVDKIDAILPQTQCGQCGYPGCKPYAEAIANGEADINQCPPGGEEGMRKLADLLGREYKPLSAEHGVEKPKSVAVIDEERPASAARCASRPARWMPSSARPSRCTRWSSRCAPAANCASRPARSTASTWCRWPKPWTPGSGATRCSS